MHDRQPPPQRWADRFGQRWRRRALTISVVLVGLVLCVLLLPLLVPLALVVDAVRRRRLSTTRFVLFLTALLAAETFGVLSCLALWLWKSMSRPSRETYLSWHFKLQELWSGAVYTAGQRLFGLRLEVTGRSLARQAAVEGPLYLFVRHVSSVDALLPSIVLANVLGLNLRYVGKRALLWDPTLDILGQRLPNLFVLRGRDLGEAQARAVAELGSHLCAGEGVAIYPEGTRVSTAQRSKVLASLERRADPLAETARELKRLLPPHRAGATALLGVARGHVVILRHAGLEGLRSLRQVLGGHAVGRVIRVDLEITPADELPENPQVRFDWLVDRWLAMDGWVDEQIVAASRATARHD